MHLNVNPRSDSDVLVLFGVVALVFHVLKLQDLYVPYDGCLVFNDLGFEATFFIFNAYSLICCLI